MPTSPGSIAAHTLATGTGWQVAEYACTAGPGDRRFEERHDVFTIAVVTEGIFTYRSSRGTVLLHPGALLLGNHGTCYECGHDHSTGDRCIAFHFDAAYFSEVAASIASTSNFAFPTPMLPLTQRLLPLVSAANAVAVPLNADVVEDIITSGLESVIEIASGATRHQQQLTATDERRISDAMRMIEQCYTEPISLDQLSRAAAMSKYHFVRTFRRVAGQAPHQYLLGQRLLRAAIRLASSAEPVSTIAFDSGFGDLSTFNARFRRQFGESPSQYRRRNIMRRRS